MFRQAPARHIRVDDGDVAYRRVGHGPDVLFVHGWPVSGATFRHLLPHLADHVTCHVLDLPGFGSSRVRPGARPTVDGHITAVRQVVDALGLDSYAVVGHDSGGLIARHAVVGDPRLRALGLIDTEQPQGLTWRFQLFLLAGRLAGFGAALAWVLGQPRLRSNPLVLGGAFHDPALLEGDFDEFFLRPLRDQKVRRDAAIEVLRSFERRHVHALAGIHQQLTIPVQLVWGEDDQFFPVARAAGMVDTFADAQLAIVPEARLFSHEERPAEVAEALLPLLRRAQ